MIDVSEVDGATIQQFHVTHGEDGLDSTPILVIGVDVLADVLKGDVGELGLDTFEVLGPVFTGQIFQHGVVVGVVLELNLFDILVQEVGDEFLVEGVGWYRDEGGHGGMVWGMGCWDVGMWGMGCWDGLVAWFYMFLGEVGVGSKNGRFFLV